MYIGGEFDVVVIGAGHAGCEAALASARMGCKTLICTINLDSIALMPCNPNIGGTAKGHLVREIDALGGEMGINTDKTFIQSRMLNTSKGPAVHSLRVQADKRQYCESMKHTIENQDGLTLRQLEVIDIEVKDGEVRGILTRNGAFFKTKTIVLTTGTYLNSSVIIGDIQFDEGPSGLSSSKFLTKSLEHIGLSIRRFKTGTPCRINRRSVDFSKMIIQEGDKEIIPFSFLNDSLSKDQVPCYLTYTNEETHNVIRENIDRSPLYNGSIKSTGPRYCPSIEDKVMRFQDKLQHQVFIEPEGINTEEMYVQGMSSSLPEDVQIEMLRTIPGLQNVEITRTGYAIEYDCIDPTELKLSLETKSIRGLFCGGQINGSSGYEEAGGQGLIAGINAARFVQDKPPVILNRSDAYIGVLIDDLVTKGTNEPYRMMTSRSEYRLVLRQDNADLRLTEIGHEIGLVNEERYNKFVTRKTAIDNEIDRIKTLQITGKSEVENWLLLKGSTSLKKPTSLYELIKRPELDYFIVKDLDINRPELPIDIMVQVNIMSKYEGYIVKQLEQINQFKKFEKKKLPEDFDYNNVRGLRIEAIQKLNKLKPDNIGQASRISGVSPADISVLMIFLEQFKSKNNY